MLSDGQTDFFLPAIISGLYKDIKTHPDVLVILAVSAASAGVVAVMSCPRQNLDPVPLPRDHLQTRRRKRVERFAKTLVS